MDQRTIEHHVTLVCELGCVRVREVIAVLQDGGTTPETASMSDSERRQVLRELEAIMAVYDART
jgi:hypothetical protein